MLKSWIIIVIFLGTLAYSQKCPYVTFQRSSIQVEEKFKKSYQIITGCVTSQNLVYTSLKKIQISSQSIPVLKKGAVADIPDWFELSITNNSIAKIDSEAFVNINVHSLTLNRNRIKWIESNAIANLPSVEVIDLENNRLTMLHEKAFNNLPNLTMISFSHNNLEDFNQNWFDKTPKLYYLFLDNNELWTLPKHSFSELPSIRRLTLDNNFIEDIHQDAFYGVPNLEELYLSNNRIKKLDIDFAGFNRLGFLALDGNFLTYLNLHRLRYVQSTLKSIFIHANPWQCACFQKILDWGKESDLTVFWKCRNEGLTCVVPENQPERCIDRPDSEFKDDVRENFNRDCVKITANH